jgi:hypothetical protein
VRAEAGQPADQVEFGQGGPPAVGQALTGGGEPVTDDGGYALVQDLAGGKVPGQGRGVQGEGQRGRPVEQACARAGGQAVAGGLGEPVVGCLPSGGAGGGALDVQYRDAGGPAAE